LVQRNRQVRESNVKLNGIRTLAVAVAAAIGVMYAAAPAMAQEKLTVWWVKGFTSPKTTR
jgi:hypothetical protein